MRVGIPREVENHEYRVAMTPAGVHEPVGGGHDVFVERDAGVGSSIPREDYALTNVTLPYAVELADRGWRGALRRDPALGLNTHGGRRTNAAVAEAHGDPSVPIEEALA